MDEVSYRQAEQQFWSSVGFRPFEHRIRLTSAATLVRVQEVGEGDPVIFIHGGPNAGSTWAPLLKHLRGLRCLLVDRPGTGLSEPFPITAQNLPWFGATFVGDLLTGLGIDRAHVVASSFGGHLALRSAAAEPERIRRMVQMACPALSPGERAPLFLRLLTVSWLRKILNALPPNERANRTILRQLGHGKSLHAERIPPGFFDWYLALQRHTDTNLNDGAMIDQILPNRSSLTLTRELLASVSVPTLFVWGEDDTFGSTEVGSRITTLMPDANLELLPETGHLPWLDDPRRVAKLTQDFLTKPARIPPTRERSLAVAEVIR